MAITAITTSTSYQQWESVLESYDSILQAARPGLVECEAWFNESLRAALAKPGAHMTKSDLIKLIEWKGKRGKFRPALVRYAKDQDSEALREASSRAFEILQEETSKTLTETTLKSALSPLLELRGIGPATASAILAGKDERVPFMSDELLEALLGRREYTLKSYTSVFSGLQSLQKELSERECGGWMSLRDMEKVVFADALRGRDAPSQGSKRKGGHLITDSGARVTVAPGKRARGRRS
jgi:hypothetical protein